MTQKTGMPAWHTRDNERADLVHGIEDEMRGLAERHGYGCYRIFAHLILVALADGSVSVSSEIFEHDSRDLRDRSFAAFGIIHDRIRAFAETKAEGREVWCILLERVARNVTLAMHMKPLESLL